MQAEQKGLELQIATLPPQASSNVMGDPTRLRQILLNLLSNALKFTREGRIALVVELVQGIHAESDGHQYERLRFHVEDSGVGIAQEAQDKLFVPFQQGDSSVTRLHGGTGLGLAIVRELCGLMGGTVSVTSTLGKGSRFTVELPFRIALEAEMQEAGLSWQPVKLLIAEDDNAHRATLLAMCNQLGWEAEAVADGDALLQRYAELEQAGEKIDCLVLNWQMPKLDGLEALYRLHQTHRPQQLPGSLMVTGADLARFKQAPHAELPDSILTKPVNISEFFNKVSLAFSKHYGSADRLFRDTHPGQNRLAWLPGVRILLVDDSAMNLDVASRILEREGAEVAVAMNGAEALDWLQTKGNRADIVLMDVQMPVMDGNTAVRAIRGIEALRTLPVIALTAAALASERSKSFEAGMDDYLTKPLDPERMVRVIRKYVEAARGNPVKVEEQHAPVESTGAWPEIPGIDLKGVRERTGDDLVLFMSLLQHFVTDNPDLTRAPALPANAEGRVELAKRMHKFAGNAGTVGVSALFHLAKEIENALLDELLEPVPAMLNALSRDYRSLLQNLQPVLRHYGRAAVEESGEAVPLDAARMQALRAALQQNQIVATGLYRELGPALRRALPEQTFNALDTAMCLISRKPCNNWKACPRGRMGRTEHEAPHPAPVSVARAPCGFASGAAMRARCRIRSRSVGTLRAGTQFLCVVAAAAFCSGGAGCDAVARSAACGAFAG